MDDHFCPFCGEHHGHALPESEAEVDVAAEVTTAEVRIAEIQADRDIKLARITAGIVDQERDEALAHAEGENEAFREVLAPEPPEETEPAEPPVVVVNDEPEPEETLPEPSETEHHESHASHGASASWFG